MNVTVSFTAEDKVSNDWENGVVDADKSRPLWLCCQMKGSFYSDLYSTPITNLSPMDEWPHNQ